MAGRPKGALGDKLWRDALRRAALERVGGKKNEQQIFRAARAIVAAAAEGDVQAGKELGDRLDGKVPQAVTGNDGGPIALAISWQPPTE